MATQQSWSNGNLEGTYTKNVTTVPNKMVRLGGLGSLVVWDSNRGKWNQSLSFISGSNRNPPTQTTQKQTFGTQKINGVGLTGWRFGAEFPFGASFSFPGCICTSSKKTYIPIPPKKTQVTECSAEPKCSPKFAKLLRNSFATKDLLLFWAVGVHHLMSLLIGSGWIWAPSWKSENRWMGPLRNGICLDPYISQKKENVGNRESGSSGHSQAMAEGSG